MKRDWVVSRESLVVAAQKNKPHAPYIKFPFRGGVPGAKSIPSPRMVGERWNNGLYVQEEERMGDDGGIVFTCTMAQTSSPFEIEEEGTKTRGADWIRARSRNEGRDEKAIEFGGIHLQRLLSGVSNVHYL